MFAHLATPLRWLGCFLRWPSLDRSWQAIGRLFVLHVQSGKGLSGQLGQGKASARSAAPAIHNGIVDFVGPAANDIVQGM